MRTKFVLCMAALLATSSAWSATWAAPAGPYPAPSFSGSDRVGNSTRAVASPEQIEAAMRRGERAKAVAGVAAGAGLVVVDVMNTPVLPGPDVGIAGASLITRTTAKAVGRARRAERLAEIATDKKTPGHIRGWLKQERTRIERGDARYTRVPPGHELAHRRGHEAAKGYDHVTGKSELIPRSLHRSKHSIDNQGKRNSDMGRANGKK